VEEQTGGKIPQNNDELIAMYGGYIASLVLRYNRRNENFEDIHQSVLLRLVEARIVEKFHRRAAEARPDALTTEEVCQHLGISVDSWCDAQALYHSGDRTISWMPTPIAGDVDSLDALWATDDVEKYEFSVYEHHEKIADSERLIPHSTGAHFRTYLQQAVHNAWANWCRTFHRRHKDRPIDFHIRPKSDHEAEMDLFDVVSDVNEAARRVVARVEVQSAIEQLQLGPAEPDFCSLLSEGCTALEAARRLKLSRSVTYRIQRLRQG